MRNILLLIWLVSVVNYSFSQKNKEAVGLSTMYNLQTESIGFGLLGEFLIKKRFSVLPQVSYYPNFNKVNELIAGIGCNYRFYEPVYNKKIMYVLINVAYNAWINYDKSYVLNATYNNWNFEIGGGFALNYCISPFIEYRYNIRWQEATVRIGVAYYIKCKKRRKTKPKKQIKQNVEGEIMEEPDFD